MRKRSQHTFLRVLTTGVLLVCVVSCISVMSNMDKMRRLTAFHEAHQEQGYECDSCHEEVDVMENTADKPAREICAICHAEMPPSSHKNNYEALHGEEYTSGPGFCEYCHRDSECISCHQVTKPKDHNTFWRRRGHGLEAEWDRSRCQTCHQEDFCIRCHSDSKPFSHTATWGGRQNGHCRFCHLPDGGASNCTVCHDMGAVGAVHSVPAPPGAAHRPGSLCLDCHRPGAGLTHFNTEENCETCHQ